MVSAGSNSDKKRYALRINFFFLLVETALFSKEQPVKIHHCSNTQPYIIFTTRVCVCVYICPSTLVWLPGCPSTQIHRAWWTWQASSQTHCYPHQDDNFSHTSHADAAQTHKHANYQSHSGMHSTQPSAQPWQWANRLIRFIARLNIYPGNVGWNNNPLIVV